MITESSSLVDVAFAVGTALDRAGVVAVLTGGSAASFYAPEAVQSDDLDFVITMRGGAGVEALANLGFSRRADYYVHEKTRFLLEFPPGPLMVGDELVTTWSTERRTGEVLHVLSATDSCRDRLAAFLFWNDFSSLEQALAVAASRRADVDLSVIRAWCARERQLDKFELFRARLG